MKKENSTGEPSKTAVARFWRGLVLKLAVPALLFSVMQVTLAQSQGFQAFKPTMETYERPSEASDHAPGAAGVSPYGQSVRPMLTEGLGQKAPPAWAQEPFDSSTDYLKPFGANLFTGKFSTSYYSGLNQTYEIVPGDRVAFQLWGAKTFNEILVVDQQGNLFIPEIGPVSVAGLSQRQLTVAVQEKLATVYSGNVSAYLNLLNTQPVAVYVTGFVNRPGRYAGGPTESPLYYLDSAGGISPTQGSYRHLEIRRGNTTLAVMDLYDFILSGTQPHLRLQTGDTIVVQKKGKTVAAIGRLPEPGLYELAGQQPKGAALLAYATPLNSVSHVSISGVRNRIPFRSHMTLDEFRSFILDDNDTVEFSANNTSEQIMVNLSGALRDGSSVRQLVRKGTTLNDFLRFIAVDETTADWAAIYLRRQKVADEQAKAIQDALRRLEHSVLTATSDSVDEANIRVKEAELIQDFVKRASSVKPNGTVVVSRRGQLLDMILEDGDTIVIPPKSSVVLVSGEVMMPNSVAWSSKMRLKDYITGAGGFTDRADSGNIVVIKPNGEVGPIKTLKIGPGDRLLVMPSYDSKNMQVFKDISQIIYHIAVATGVVLNMRD